MRVGVDQAQGEMRAPAIFVSHGSPLMASASNEYTAALRSIATSGPLPSAVVVVSAHWRTPDRRVSGARQLETLHDFGGFPDELYELSYPCAGVPMLAHRIADRIAAIVDRERGLDHGAWMPLRHMFPFGDVPIVPVSLPARASPGILIELGRQLAFLRAEGVWILGTGGLVYNLGSMQANGAAPPDWARAFDRWVSERVAALDLPHLIEFRREAPHPALALPAPELFDPLFVVLGAALPGDRVKTIYEGFEMGTVSLRTFSLSDGPLRG